MALALTLARLKHWSNRGTDKSSTGSVLHNIQVYHRSFPQQLNMAENHTPKIAEDRNNNVTGKIPIDYFRITNEMIRNNSNPIPWTGHMRQKYVTRWYDQLFFLVEVDTRRLKWYEGNYLYLFSNHLVPLGFTIKILSVFRSCV